MSAGYSTALYLPEGCLMDSLDPASPAAAMIGAASPPTPRVWKFWGTTLWGCLIIVAFFIGQIAPIGYFLLRYDGPLDSLDQLAAALIEIASRPLTIPLSAIAGLPGMLIPTYFAIRYTRTPFADYLALRWTTGKNLALGVAGMVLILGCWELIPQLTGREETSSAFMVDILKTAQGGGLLWLLVVAFCVVAPISEELLARGFLYRGWSESFLRIPGAIILSSLVWTMLHLQYDWFALLNVFSLGLWFGYLRYRTHSILLTMVLHGLNNFAATLQTMWLANGHGG
jgi:membrane protease YdiL (CAAX protease family)